jgi:hypothetical protein
VIRRNGHWPDITGVRAFAPYLPTDLSKPMNQSSSWRSLGSEFLGKRRLVAGRKYASHYAVNHTVKEYARGEVTTNTVEGFYSNFKRAMKGTYQHCAEKHLHR